MRSYWLDLRDPAQRILYKFGLSARGKTELEILKKLSQGSANVYTLNREIKSEIDVHYSTVLRALRRLEKKGLVRLVSQRNSGRREKTYACTLLGQLVVALAKKGISSAIRIMAENSKTFRECIKVHLPSNLEYPSLMMESLVLKILDSKNGRAVLPSKLDDYFRDIEFEWIRTNIVRQLFPDPYDFDFADRYYIHLNQPLSRHEILMYLRKIVHIAWIRDFVIPVIERYMQTEKQWLQGLEDFKREVKLARVHELTDNNQS